MKYVKICVQTSIFLSKLFSNLPHIAYMFFSDSPKLSLHFLTYLSNFFEVSFQTPKHGLKIFLFSPNFSSIFCNFFSNLSRSYLKYFFQIPFHLFFKFSVINLTFSSDLHKIVFYVHFKCLQFSLGFF